MPPWKRITNNEKEPTRILFRLNRDAFSGNHGQSGATQELRDFTDVPLPQTGLECFGDQLP